MLLGGGRFSSSVIPPRPWLRRPLLPAPTSPVSRAAMATPDQKSPNVLLQNLCCRILGKSEGNGFLPPFPPSSGCWNLRGSGEGRRDVRRASEPEGGCPAGEMGGGGVGGAGWRGAGSARPAAKGVPSAGSLLVPAPARRGLRRWGGRLGDPPAASERLCCRPGMAAVRRAGAAGEPCGRRWACDLLRPRSASLAANGAPRFWGVRHRSRGFRCEKRLVFTFGDLRLPPVPAQAESLASARSCTGPLRLNVAMILQ